MNLNTHPFPSMYDISNDGQKVAFSGHLRSQNEWTSGYKTYYFDSKTKTIECISDLSKDEYKDSKTLKSQFSKDDKIIAYLAIKNKRLKSESKHFEFYDIENKKIKHLKVDDEKYAPNSFLWSDENTNIFEQDFYGTTKLFTVNFENFDEPIFNKYPVREEKSSYSLPIYTLENSKNSPVIVVKNSYNHPPTLNLLNDDEDEIVNLNEEIIEDIELSQYTNFIYYLKMIRFKDGLFLL